MFDSVQFVREICEERNIPISTLERECGFSNGYLNPKKLKKLPYDRAAAIGEYLGISAERILTGTEQKNAPAPSRRDILDEIDIAFYGDFRELTEEQKEAVRDMVRVMRERRSRREN